MIADSEGFGKVQVGSSFHLMIAAETKEEADTLFAKLSEGGKVSMPMGQSFWNTYFGMCTDKFGIRWMFSFG
jgi:PhnB protein